MQFLNGFKTILGIAIALLACLVSHGFSLSALLDCIKQVGSGQTMVGVGLGIASLGIAHKIEKKVQAKV